MSIRIRFPDEIEAAIDGGIWSSEIPELGRFLNQRHPSWAEEVSTSEPDRDWAVAKIASEELGAKVIDDPRRFKIEDTDDGPVVF